MVGLVGLFSCGFGCFMVYLTIWCFISVSWVLRFVDSIIQILLFVFCVVCDDLGILDFKVGLVGFPHDGLVFGVLLGLLLGGVVGAYCLVCVGLFSCQLGCFVFEVVFGFYCNFCAGVGLV